MNKAFETIKDDVYQLHMRGYTQQQIADKLNISQPKVSRVLSKIQKTDFYTLARKSVDEYFDVYTRAQRFFDYLLVQIDQIDTDEPDLKLKKINQAASIMKDALYLATQGKFMLFTQTMQEHQHLEKLDQPKLEEAHYQ